MVSSPFFFKLYLSNVSTRDKNHSTAGIIPILPSKQEDGEILQILIVGVRLIGELVLLQKSLYILFNYKNT